MSERFNQRQKASEIKWIPVKNISVVWAEAQRPLNDKHAQRIADNFDPDMFGTLAVTKPNGQGIYHVVDGHHRKVAVERLWGKDENVPCQVFDAEDPARAAQLFDHINSARKNPQPLEIFKVRVAAGKELQVEVNRIVHKTGYAIGTRREGSLHCVAALEAIYQSCGPIVLEATLRLINKVWGKDNSATTAHIIRGFGMFLSEFRTVDVERLVNCVAAKYTPARLLGSAAGAREIHGGTLPGSIKDLMVTSYNNTVRSEKMKLKSGKKKD